MSLKDIASPRRETYDQIIERKHTQKISKRGEEMHKKGKQGNFWLENGPIKNKAACHSTVFLVCHGGDLIHMY